MVARETSLGELFEQRLKGEEGVSHMARFPGRGSSECEGTCKIQSRGLWRLAQGIYKTKYILIVDYQIEEAPVRCNLMKGGLQPPATLVLIPVHIHCFRLDKWLILSALLSINYVYYLQPWYCYELDQCLAYYKCTGNATCSGEHCNHMWYSKREIV